MILEHPIMSLDLDYVDINSLERNGARIIDEVGNDVDTLLAAPGTPNSISDDQEITIDTNEPTLEDIDTPNLIPLNPLNGDIDVDTLRNLQITFNEIALGVNSQGNIQIFKIWMLIPCFRKLILTL